MLLVYKGKDGVDATFRLTEKSLDVPVTIGRGKEADILLDDRRASRIHASVLCWDGAYIIRDMNSDNGVYVNGNRTPLSFIRPGDILEIADTKFRLVSSGSSDDVTMEGIVVRT